MPDRVGSLKAFLASSTSTATERTGLPCMVSAKQPAACEACVRTAGHTLHWFYDSTAAVIQHHPALQSVSISLHRVRCSPAPEPLQHTFLHNTVHRTG